jgi:nucleotide-binding universal stress UspA family protein
MCLNRRRLSKMHEILAAVDGTDGGRSAADEALALASEVGASVTFVYVRPSSPKVLGAPFYQNVLSIDLRHARSVGAEAVALASARGVEAEFEILEGDPADEIVSLADNRDVDLIVVGSRGRGAVAGAILGSVSGAVARHANRPVLVAKQAPARHAVVA